MATLFEKVGGTPAVTALIDGFYAKVLTSEVSSPFFVGKDADRVKRLQVEFFSVALGSGGAYTGQGMRAVHTGLGITDDQFNAVAEMLSNTMKEMGLSDEIYHAVMNFAASQKGDIVGL